MGRTITALSLVSLVVSGCAASAETTPAQATGGEQNVTGVTDLGDLEAEIGMVKDQKDDQGNWSRPEAVVTAGSCYKRLILGPDGPNYDFRRYTTGAAFFSKLGAGPASGDQRPVLCVDVDGQSFDPSLYSLYGVQLDMVMRFHEGRPQYTQGAAGHLYVGYANGSVEVGDPSHYCGFYGPDANDNAATEPAHFAGTQASNACVQQQGAAACASSYEDACEPAMVADVQQDTIDRPAFGDSYLYYYYPNRAGGGVDSQRSVDAVLVSLVYRFAHKAAADVDTYSWANDPVGKLVAIEAPPPSLPDRTIHVRFDSLDAHLVDAGPLETIAITPKGSDANIIGAALAICTRTLSNTTGQYGRPTSVFTCQGL